jgi:hypothetical protein
MRRAVIKHLTQAFRDFFSRFAVERQKKHFIRRNATMCLVTVHSPSQ